MILITLSNGTICSFWHGLNDSDSFEFRLYVILWHLEHSIWVGACEFLRPHSGAWTTQDHSDNSRWDFGSSGNLDGLLKVLVGDITVLLMFLCFESCHWKTPSIFKKNGSLNTLPSLFINLAWQPWNSHCMPCEFFFLSWFLWLVLGSRVFSNGWSLPKTWVVDVFFAPRSR